MIIEYKLKRFDLVKSYPYNLRRSKRTQLVVFGGAAFFFCLSLFRSYRSHGSLLLPDFIVALLTGTILILIIPVLGFLTAKTQKRTLSINQEGIETTIGTLTGKVPWSAIDSVFASKDFVFIVGKSANTFTIPSRAFASNDLQNKFIELATQYHRDAQNASIK